MGLIKFGAGVSKISGKIGGVVYANNKGGAYAREWVVPVNPNTPRQQKIRNYMAEISGEWRELTKGLQIAWANAAKNRPFPNRLGDMKILSGIAFYNSVNLYLMNHSESTTGVASAPLTVPPPASAPVQPTVTNVIATASVPDELSITFSPTPMPANNAIYVDMTQILSPGMTSVSNKWRFVNSQLAAGASPASLEVPPRFASLVVGGIYAVRVRTLDTNSGQITPGDIFFVTAQI